MAESKPLIVTHSRVESRADATIGADAAAVVQGKNNMNVDQQQPDDANGAKGIDDKASARRRLIRGSFAAPAILALHSGRAFAQASGAARCLANQNTQPVPAAPTNPDISWFRYRLWVIRRNNGAGSIVNSLGQWVKGDNLSVYTRNGLSPFLAAGSWWQFNVANNGLVNTGATTTPPSPQPNTNQVLIQTGAYVVLRVSSAGQLVGAGSTDVNGGIGAPVIATCWNSFALATKP